MNRFLIVLQVERRVVDKLIDAQDRKLLSPGCSLYFTVDHPQGHSGKSLGDDEAPTIKLQLKKMARKKLTSMLETREVH